VLQLKNLCGRSAVEEVTTWDEKILKELEGLSGRKAWFAGTLLVQGPDRAGTSRNLRSAALPSKVGAGQDK